MQPAGTQEQHRQMRTVVPTREDPLLARFTAVVGGPLGRRTAPGLIRPGAFTVDRVLIVLTTLAALLALVLKEHCRSSGWNTPDQFYATCYSDLPQLFGSRGLAGGLFPMFGSGPRFEYPVLTSFIAGFTALLVPGTGAGAARALDYFDVNATLLAAAWVGAVVLTARMNRRRPWDAAMVAVAPGIILAGYINWDLWAVLALAAALLLFARRHVVAAGLLVGIGASLKIYPALLLLVLLLLAVRSGRYRAFVTTAVAAAAAWLALNLPAAVSNFGAWAYFYQYSAQRAAGYSSPWYAWNEVAGRMQWTALSAGTVGALAVALFLLAFLALAVLALAAPRRPRVGQLLFLLVAAFVLVNKVYSPQYVLWLIPLFVIARPRWLEFLLWQAAEALHWAAIWLFLGQQTSGGNLQHNIDVPYYVLAVALHMIALMALMGLVVRDILHPACDVVRRRGVDDPLGGAFNRSPDSFVLHRARPADALR